MPVAAGSRLGPYEILAPLGVGGMGEVYRARDTRLERDVAVKVIPEAARGEPDASARFKREALALSRLNHPNIEMVLDVGEERDTAYIVLELVPGETLAARIARGRVPEREAAEIGAQVAEALAEAHERGVVHRDLKPGNVMVTPKGRVKVLDFGLARMAQAPSEETPTAALTQVGTTTGTLAYMAPEQLLGQFVDARSDLYALGVVLYEMTTAARPFQAPLATALANEILHGTPVLPREREPSLSKRLEAVVLRALDRDRGQRYQTAGEMLGELRRLAAPDSVEPRSDSSASVSSARRVTSIAVLPLENLSGDPTQEYFSDGMTEELISSLAQVRALRIISRTSVLRYKGQRKSIPEIARELNVDAVVEGSVRRAGDRVRITAQLIEAATERHLWARSYERDLKEVFALQGEVASAIVEEIQVSVTPQEETLLKGSARTVDAEAYEHYLKGRYHIEQRTEAHLRTGLALLEQAVQRDDHFELAHIGIADAYNLMGFMCLLAPREAFPRAQAAARRALELAPSSAEALTSLGYAALWHDWDLEESERLFRRSIDLAPKYSQAHLWFTNQLMVTGRFEEAETEARLARILDPQSNVAMAFAGWSPYWQGRYEDAWRMLMSVREHIPEFGPLHYWLGHASMRAGRDADAVAAFERCAALVGRAPMVVSGLATAHALAGREAEARSLLQELERMASQRYVGAYHIAQVQLALGEREAALANLERALDERVHWLVAANRDPALAALRGEPRFEAILARVKSRA